LPKVRQPIFIVGCGRSGTTLLFDILSTHPELVRTKGYPDGEDHEGWVRYGKCVMAGIGNVHHANYGTGINGQQYCLHMTQEDVTKEIVRDMHQYYREDVLGGDNRKRVLNKQPHLSNKLDYVLGIFPDAKIIHIVRDCEPTVASWLAAMADPTLPVVYWPQGEEFPCFWLMPKPEDSVTRRRLSRHPQFYPGGGSDLWIDYWCKVNSGIEKQVAERIPQLLTIRYEDLITLPETILGRITRFCELPDFEFKLPQLQTDTAKKHSHLMTSELKEKIARRAGAVRQLFHYEPGSPASPIMSLFLP
jgi:hypothetical protein